MARMAKRKWLLHRIRVYEKRMQLNAEDYLGFKKRVASIEDLQDLLREMQIDWSTR